jgi:hypothetical protein
MAYCQRRTLRHKCVSKVIPPADRISRLEILTVDGYRTCTVDPWGEQVGTGRLHRVMRGCQWKLPPVRTQSAGHRYLWQAKSCTRITHVSRNKLLLAALCVSLLGAAARSTVHPSSLFINHSAVFSSTGMQSTLRHLSQWQASTGVVLMFLL